jgi:hypothetical protein
VERGLKCTPATETTLPQARPPVIEYFRPVPPATCIQDAAGTSIEVEWSARFVTSVTFFVDGIRTSSESRRKGSKQLPFTCDGKPHPVQVQVVGPVPPLATSTFSLTLAQP